VSLSSRLSDAWKQAGQSKWHRELMEAISGEIEVRDTPGGGATFVLRLADAGIPASIETRS